MKMDTVERSCSAFMQAAAACRQQMGKGALWTRLVCTLGSVGASENSPADCQISPPSPAHANKSPRLLDLQLKSEHACRLEFFWFFCFWGFLIKLAIP